MSENKHIVYKHTAPSGKIYIGVTGRKAKDRWDSGHGYRQNKYFWNAIQKYGWKNIKSEIIFENLSSEDAFLKEQELIVLYESNDREKGYNLSNGGKGGSLGAKLSKETRKKMSLSRTGSKHPMFGKKHSLKTRNKLSEIMSGENHPQFGTKASESKIRKLRQANTGSRHPMYGKKHTDTHKQRIKESIIKVKGRKVICIDTGVLYLSASLAAESTGANPSHILSCCKGIRKTAGGYKWKYGEEVITSDR